MKLEGLNPIEQIAVLAQELQTVRSLIGLPVDDQIGLISLASLAEQCGCETTKPVTNMIKRHGGKTVTVGTGDGAKHFVRKTVWLDVLKANEEQEPVSCAATAPGRRQDAQRVIRAGKGI
jgi:hypothetical protein